MKTVSIPQSEEKRVSVSSTMLPKSSNKVNTTLPSTLDRPVQKVSVTNIHSQKRESIHPQKVSVKFVSQNKKIEDKSFNQLSRDSFSKTSKIVFN